MCRCTPTLRTPFCGKPGCQAPEQRPSNVGACHHAKVYVLAFHGQPEPYGLECPFCVRDRLQGKLDKVEEALAAAGFLGTDPTVGIRNLRALYDAAHNRVADEPPARRDVVAVIQQEMDADVGPGGLGISMADRIAIALGAADLLWRESEPPRAGMDTPWPLHDVLAKLIEATEHLLGQHNCDAHGHEEFRTAAEAGKRLLPETKSDPEPDIAVQHMLEADETTASEYEPADPAECCIFGNGSGNRCVTHQTTWVTGPCPATLSKAPESESDG